MKLLHFADLHLGVETHGSPDASTGIPTRVADFLKAFDAIVDAAIDEQYDAVLFAGDAFKNRDPNQTVQREFARRVRKLSNAGVPVVILLGNHDLPIVQSRATSLDIYRVLEVPGVHIVRRPGRLRVQTRSGDLQVVGMPWVTRSSFLQGDQYRDATPTELDNHMSAGIGDFVSQSVTMLDPDLPAVLLAHLSIEGARLGTEQSIMIGPDLTIGLDDLGTSGFDYIALGHIHKHQQLAARPPAVYAGSPERIDFGEENEAKGFVRVTIEPNTGSQRRTQWEFVELPARPFFTLRIDASGDVPMTRVEQHLERQRAKISGAIVRCFIEVDSGNDAMIDLRSVRRMLLDLGANYVAGIRVESERLNRARDASFADASADEITMLGRFLEQKGYDVKTKARILELGREMIRQFHEDGRRVK